MQKVNIDLVLCRYTDRTVITGISKVTLVENGDDILLDKLLDQIQKPNKEVWSVKEIFDARIAVINTLLVAVQVLLLAVQLFVYP